MWLRRGEEALRSLEDPQEEHSSEARVATNTASMTRSGRLWTISWCGNECSIPHSKGLADIAELVRHRGEEIPALRLVGNATGGEMTNEPLIDHAALDAYRMRLEELDTEIDQADTDADIGRIEMLHREREQLLAEIRSTTGLGGRLRNTPNGPAERARKAVSARIRDAIGNLHSASPQLAAHLDRSIRTGVRCTYAPAADDQVLWIVEDR